MSNRRPNIDTHITQYMATIDRSIHSCMHDKLSPTPEYSTGIERFHIFVM